MYLYNIKLIMISKAIISKNLWILIKLKNLLKSIKKKNQLSFKQL